MSTLLAFHLWPRVIPALAATALVAFAACSPDSPFDAPDATDDRAYESQEALTGTTRIRVMAANLTSGTDQSYTPGHGSRIFQGVKPDIVLIQEFNYGSNSTADIRSFVDTTFGSTFWYYREGGAQIPNGVVSRYPILASGEWDDTSVSNRDFAWAKIDIPGPVDLWAVSVHLLTSSSSSRSAEAQQLVSLIKSKIPSGDYLVLGGDLNTGSRGESCISTLSQVVVTSGPYPADRNGNTYTNATRSKPYDWVLADTDLDAYRTAVVLGGSSFTNGLVADTRVYSPLSELSPALWSDSDAAYMQHMGVVRDFMVPGDSTGSSSSSSSSSGGGGTAQVFVNEILANEPGSDTNAEFVEIVNTGTAAADLSGWTLSDSASVRHTFAAGTTLEAGRAMVVFGGASGIPAGLGNAVAASSGSLGLSNSGDTVTLKDDHGTAVNGYTYSSSLSGSDGVSMNRDPDGSASGGFVLHTTLSADGSSPGVQANGSGF